MAGVAFAAAAWAQEGETHCVPGAAGWTFHPVAADEDSPDVEQSQQGWTANAATCDLGAFEGERHVALAALRWRTIRRSAAARAS